MSTISTGLPEQAKVLYIENSEIGSYGLMPECRKEGENNQTVCNFREKNGVGDFLELQETFGMLPTGYSLEYNSTGQISTITKISTEEIKRLHQAIEAMPR